MPSSTSDLGKCLRRRGHILEALTRPRQKCELARDLEESRSTIDRALRELERAGFVKRVPDGYRTTLAGELALAEHHRYTDRLAGLAEHQDALSALPCDAPLHAALFQDADVSFPTRHSPQKPVRDLEAALSDARHVEVFAPAVTPRYVEIYSRRISDAGMTADLVLSSAVVEWLLANRQETLETAVETDGVTVARASVELCFGLLLMEHERDGTGHDDERSDSPAGESDREQWTSTDRQATPDETGSETAGAPSPVRPLGDRSVGVMLYDDGTLLGFVHNDAPTAVAWADRLYEEVAAEATPLSI